MADPTFDPVAGLIDPDTYSKIADQWTSFLEAPGGRAALLQTGIAMSQPLSWGQSNFGAFAGALGSGGEAAVRGEALGLRRQEAESKMDLREAQAGAAEARAVGAGSKLEAQGAKLEHAKTLAQLKASNQLRQMHSQYENKQRALNEKIEGDILNPPPGKPGHRSGTPILPFEQWLQTDPQALDLAKRSGFSIGDGAAVAPSRAPAAAPTSVISPAPPNPGDRQVGVTYDTPKGPLTWTGTGWR